MNLDQFRTKYLAYLARIEGVSMLFLMVSMPIKYGFGFNAPTRWIGSIHGLLFVMFIFTVFTERRFYQWKFKDLILALIAATLPFGTFWWEKKALTGQAVPRHAKFRKF